jgi:hypothetical protein
VPQSRSDFLAREAIRLGLQIHLADLIQYVLLSIREEMRLWDEGQK